MKSNIEYDKKIAKKFHDTGYYESEQFIQKNISFMNEEKSKHKTENKDEVTKKIKLLLDSIGNNDKVFIILEKIYEKNQNFAFGKSTEKPINSDLLNLLSDISLLITSYNKVRKNRGAMTKASEMSENNYKDLDPEEKSWINKTTNSPDSLTKKDFIITSKLIKENKYPWGTSRRIYVDKPGKKDSKRPIIIPSFMDKVVQQALTTILTSIYEPYFEALNCSFGFRPNKGVHDAIAALTNANTRGYNIALEGDIKSAYDKVVKSKFIKILEKKIHDRKFIKFIEKRLNYEFYDTLTKKHINPDEGLPQGGIDSLYLWNIYMTVFDEFIIESLNNYVNKLNQENLGKRKKSVVSTEKRLNQRQRTTVRRILEFIKEIKEKDQVEQLELLAKMNLKEIKEKGIITGDIITGEIMNPGRLLKPLGIGKIKDAKTLKQNIIKYGKQLFNEWKKMPTSDQNRIYLKFKYVRYADDWIILTNMKEYMLITWKEKISEFLMNEFGAKLSIEKTLITNIKKNSAHFLGYEIKTYANKQRGTYTKNIKEKKIKISAIVAGSKVFALPDRQRLIDRLHMKGYCDKHGFPKEIGFLTYLEDFIIIERYNSVLRGIAVYYTEFVRNPRRTLSRWTYIIRYSCIKTLAKKHKTSVRKIFKKYSAKIPKNQVSKARTIEVVVKNKIDNDTYTKKWTLLTLDKLIKYALSLKRREIMFDRYWSLQKGIPMLYERQDKHCITNDNFYKKLMWINIRTSASFDLPCNICGSTEEIEMHHIKHVRKNRYDLIDKDKTWQQAMFLKNRKQIPVCKECHTTVIHRGKYGGIKLSKITPRIMYDNRLITIESNLNAKALLVNKANHVKNLEKKGWKKDKESSKNED